MKNFNSKEEVGMMKNNPTHEDELNVVEEDSVKPQSAVRHLFVDILDGKALALRERPSEKSKIIGVIPDGSTIKFLNKSDETWCEVFEEKDGKRGFVKSQYTKEV